MSTYLVTGASGFLGMHLVARLRSLGHSVVALCRNPTAVARRSPEGVRWVKGDVVDAAIVREAATGVDGAFHLAGLVSFRDRDAEELHRIHVTGTRTVLDVCKSVGVRRVVHCSTSGTVAISEDADHVSVETDETPIGLINRWPYYRAKLFAEREALSKNGSGFEVISVNPTLLLGPGDDNRSSTEDVALFLEGKIPAIPPGGMSFVDARDAAEALWLAMEKGTPGSRYLIGACNLSLREFFARLERASGVKGPRLPVPRSPAVASMGVDLVSKLLGKVNIELPLPPQRLDMAQFFWYLDASKAEKDLGWKAREPSQTLLDTIRDLRDRGIG